MTREDFLAELMEAPAQVDATGPDVPLTAADARAPAGPPPGPTALRLDEWSMRRGGEIRRGEVLTPILRERAEKIGETAADAEGYEPGPLDYAAADFFGAAFEPCPELAPEGCSDQKRGRYMRQLLESEQFAELHASTRLDPMASELAAGHFARGWLELTDDDAPGDAPSGAPGDAPGDAPGEKKGDDAPGEEKGDGAAGEAPGAEKDDFAEDLDAMSAAADALKKAGSDVDDLQDARRSLGGDGPCPGESAPLDVIRERFRKIKDSRQLRLIMQYAGRFRRTAQARQREKTLHGRDDMVGAELGNDLARLVPTELAMFADEDLELDAYRRYAEGSMMLRRYRGVEPQGQGPIVVVVDESGSMHGEPIARAKAFALAMAWIARHQRRWIGLIGFSGGAETGHSNTLIMPPNKWDQGAMLDWLEHFYSGGSHRDVPIVELPRDWESYGCPEGKTDVVCVTDAYCVIERRQADAFNEWKAQVKARFNLLALQSDPGDDLRRCCDRVWIVPSIDATDLAIQELLSI